MPKLKPETMEARKVHILKAARTCFVRKGYHQTTMDDIVQEAGLSKGGVYWHFDSKKELFLAIIESTLGASQVAMRESLASQASAREKLNTVMAAFAEMVTSNQLSEIAPLTLGVWAQNWQDPDVNKVVTKVYKQFRDSVVQMIEQGIAQGEFKPVNAMALTSILLALYDGLMVQVMIDEDMVDWGAISETLKNTLIASLLTGESAEDGTPLAAGNSHSDGTPLAAGNSHSDGT